MLLLNVLLITVSVAMLLLLMPAPNVPVLPLMVVPVIVKAPPSEKMAPPLVAVLSPMVLLVRDSVAPPPL